MSEKLLMKGNEAIAEAAMRAGCRHFFGYPITPQTEISAYMAKNMPKIGGVFLQAESEVAAINMVYGAAGAGARAMTSSSSPGISLKAEGLSYIAGADLPCVIVNIVRAGPGLGGILPSQADYFQATKGGGHGGYHTIVLAPSTIQETVNITIDAFDLAEKYRVPVMIMGDGLLGQMMEPVEFPEITAKPAEKPWATTGTKCSRNSNVINSLDTNPDRLEEKNDKREAVYNTIRQNEQRAEVVDVEDADVVLVAYGTSARVAKAAMEAAREQGLKVGLVRPISLWPFPSEAIQKVAKTAKAFLSVEMSYGQMVEDVKLNSLGKPVHFYGRNGGNIMTPGEVLKKIESVL